MSAITPAAVFDLHVARSAFIDAFNLVDLAIRERLLVLGQKACALTGQNLDALAKVPANPNYSKIQKETTLQLIAAMRELQSIRCDVVHSRMQTVATSEGTVAFFDNVQNASTIGRRCLILTKEELDTCIARFTEIARDLHALNKKTPAKTS